MDHMSSMGEYYQVPDGSESPGDGAGAEEGRAGQVQHPGPGEEGGAREVK